MTVRIHRFTHHDTTGAVICFEEETLDLNEFLSEEHRSAEPSEYSFAYTCCVLNHRGRHVLIDAGFEPEPIVNALADLGVGPDEIELILLTHADRDHVAGLLSPEGKPIYANARHVIGRELWTDLRKPETLASLADNEEREAFFRRFVAAFDDRMELFDGERDVADGVRFVPCPGHRIGHAVYELATGGSPLLHTGDALFHPLFAEQPSWPNVTDSTPDQAVESRQRLVAHAAETGALVLSSHIPYPGIGRIAPDGAAHRWTPAA